MNYKVPTASAYKGFNEGNNHFRIQLYKDHFSRSTEDGKEMFPENKVAGGILKTKREIIMNMFKTK